MSQFEKKFPRPKEKGTRYLIWKRQREGWLEAHNIFEQKLRDLMEGAIDDYELFSDIAREIEEIENGN